MFEGYKYAEKGGGPARNRFADPAALYAVYQKLTEDDMADAQRRAKIRRLYDGNKPYRTGDLEARAVKHLTNVNFNGLWNEISSRADSVLALQTDNVDLVELRPIARELAGPEAERVGEIVASEVSTLLRDNGRFIPAMSMMVQESDLYGLGPVTWSSPLDYNPVALERGQIRFLEDAPIVSSQNELVMFESTISADYLQSVRDNGPVSEQAGWRLPVVDRWFKAVFRDGADTRYGSLNGSSGTTVLESALSERRRNIVAEDRQFDQLHVIHAFVRETAWPRGVTHIMLPANGEVKDFLFYRQNAYRTMDDCFLWLPATASVKYAREARGIASRLYFIERARNRLMCSTVDSAVRSLSLVLTQQGGAVQQSQLTLQEEGPYTLLPPGIVPSNAQAGANMQQLVGVLQLLDRAGRDATIGAPPPSSGSLARIFEGPSQSKTKKEEEQERGMRTRRTEADYAKRKFAIDRICRQAFVRILNLAMLPEFMRVDFPEIQAFVERCAMRQVTMEHLLSIPQFYTIGASRELALGADGMAAELDAFNQLYGGIVDEAGRREIARKRAILRFGQKEADRIIPESNRDKMPSDQASKAVDENNLMKLGFKPMMGQDQWHWSHIPVHAQLLQEIVEMVQAPEDNTPELNEWNGDPQQSMQIAERTLQNLQEDPKKILGILVTCSRHVQEHLSVGGSQVNMHDQAKQVEKMLRDLRPTIKALNLAVATQERVEQAQREQAERDQQAAIDQAAEEKAQVARIEADKKAETDRYRIDRESEVARYRAEVEAGREGRRMDMEESRMRGEEARRDAQAEAQIVREEKIAGAKANAANAVARMNAVQDATGFRAVRPDQVAEMGPLDYTSL